LSPAVAAAVKHDALRRPVVTQKCVDDNLPARREGSSRKAAPEGRAGGVLPVRWPHDRGRQRRGWAPLVALAL